MTGTPRTSARRRTAASWVAPVAILLALTALPGAAGEYGDETAVELVGAVSSLQAPSSFILDGAVTVTTSGDTEWKDGISGWSGLSGQLAVRVRGRWAVEGSELAAAEVRLAEPGDDHGGADTIPGIGFESRSRVDAVMPPDRFVMADGRTYTVDGATVFDPVVGSFAGISAGQYLEVRAVRVGDGVHLVRSLEYEGDAGSGQGYGEVYGEVAAVTDTRVELTGGDVLVHDRLTVWVGDADRWQDAARGWRVEAEVFHDRLGRLVARTVRCEDDRFAGVAGEEFEPREAVVVIAEGADPAAFAARVGAELIATVGDVAALLRWPAELDDALLSVVAADPEAAAVEPNYRFRDPESVRRRYPIVDGRSGMSLLRTQEAARAANLHGAAVRSTGRGAVVALLDTGVDPDHATLRGRLLPGFDLVDGDGFPWETRDGIDSDGDGELDEASGHGTFVASVVATVAPAASLLPIRVLDDDGGGSAFALALGLARAIEAQVDVVNLSLVYHRRSTAVDLLLERAAARGIVVVASAGNDSSEVVPFPASDSHVIGVTAVAQGSAALAPFANRSGLVAVAAPGEDILGALDGGRYGTWSGTSMAAPFVTGTAALLKGVDPGIDLELVRAALAQGSAVLVDGPWQGVRLDAGGTVALIAPASSRALPVASGRRSSAEGGWRCRPGCLTAQ